MRDPAELVVRLPRTIVLLCLAATVALALVARGVRIEGSIESVLPANDPGVQYYADVRATFGSDDIAVVGVRADDLFTPATLTRIAQVTDQLAALPGVERVLSLTNTVDVAADVFKPPPLLPNIPPSPAEIGGLKAKLAATPLYAQNLVAPDQRGAAINIFLKPLSDAEYDDLAIDENIQAILDAEPGPVQFYYTGASHVGKVAVQLMRLDLLRFTPLALVLVLLILWLSFRRIRAVVLPLVAVLLAVVWTIGIMVLAGKSITLGTFVLPPLLLVMGSVSAMHVVAAYYEALGDGRRPADAVVTGLRSIRSPLLISSLTASIGFASLMTNQITAVWDLGIFSVVGLACIAFISLVFLPAALQVWSAAAGRAAAARPAAVVERLMGQLG
ncbi:MAG: MMPL family transporter, partial [Candidatus Binatia bacterium]